VVVWVCLSVARRRRARKWICIRVYRSACLGGGGRGDVYMTWELAIIRYDCGALVAFWISCFAFRIGLVVMQTPFGIYVVF